MAFPKPETQVFRVPDPSIQYLQVIKLYFFASDSIDASKETIKIIDIIESIPSQPWCLLACIQQLSTYTHRKSPLDISMLLSHFRVPSNLNFLTARIAIGRQMTSYFEYSESYRSKSLEPATFFLICSFLVKECAMLGVRHTRNNTVYMYHRNIQYSLHSGPEN